MTTDNVTHADKLYTHTREVNAYTNTHKKKTQTRPFPHIHTRKINTKQAETGTKSAYEKRKNTRGYSTDEKEREGAQRNITTYSRLKEHRVTQEQEAAVELSHAHTHAHTDTGGGMQAGNEGSR